MDNKLIKKIKSKLNPFMAKLDGYSSQGSEELKILRIRTTNNFLITFINSKDKDFWIDTERDGAVIFDKNFSILKHFFLKETLNTDEESYDSKNFVKSSITILKTLTLKKQSLGPKMLDENFIFKLKKLIIKECHLDDNLAKDYFLFGNDEFRIRYYKDITPLKSIHDRLVKINDDSAIIFYKDGKMNNIDLSTGTCWMTNTKFYPNVKPRLIQATSDDYDFTQYSSKDNKTSYLKKEIPTKKQLKDQKFIKIKKAKNMIFKLIKVNDVFMFEDLKTKDRIHIGHPDLLITLV